MRSWRKVVACFLLCLGSVLACEPEIGAKGDDSLRVVLPRLSAKSSDKGSGGNAKSMATASRAVPARSHPSGGLPAQEYGNAESGIRLFGTVELRSNIGNQPKWNQVLQTERKNPGFVDSRTFPGGGTWKDFRKSLAGLSSLEKIKRVNALINRWPYRTDMEVWGVIDYWAAPVDFFKKSGDCEDYSIAKYFALRALGFPASSMRIVVLKDTLRNLAHAVLVVYEGDDALVLDNLSNSVLSHKIYKQYVPQFSVNESSRWAHFRRDSMRNSGTRR